MAEAKTEKTESIIGCIHTDDMNYAEKAGDREDVRACVLSRVQLLVTAWTVACQAPLSMGFSRQECWSGLPFPSPGDLPDPRIELRSPAWQADSLPLYHLGSPRGGWNSPKREAETSPRRRQVKRQTQKEIRDRPRSECRRKTWRHL